MKAFVCRVCNNSLYFENSVCVSCSTALGYSREEQAIVPLDDQGQYVDAEGLIWHVCANLNLSGCTWVTQIAGELCFSCSLTRTRPADEDLPGLANFPVAEAAKRHLIAELDALGFPVVGKDEDPEQGLAFDLLNSGAEGAGNVVIGHDNGIITMDLAEGDDAYREKVRVELAEPYRTMLGHFRHESGHYYEWQLVRGDDALARCRELFGDESTDYQAEIDRHYAEGPPVNWEKSYISTYATMHPFEDFAETWAHFLHISDTVESARSAGLVSSTPPADFRSLVVGVWVPLSIALNQINRSMGKEDLYPFVLPAPVLDKLEFVASLTSSAPWAAPARDLVS